MNDLSNVKAICFKICMLIASVEDDYQYSTTDILYHLAISDFVDEEGQTNNMSIRNINSILYYSKYLNYALLKLSSFNLIVIDGYIIKKAFATEILYSQCLEIRNRNINKLMKKMSLTHKLCRNTRNIVELYEQMYDSYLKNKLYGEIND